MTNYYSIQVDTIGSDVANLPADLLAVMGYVTGTDGIAWTEADWNRFPYAGKVTVDQSESLDVFAAGHANVADIENGAGTIATFLDAAREREKLKIESYAYIQYDNLATLMNRVVKSKISNIRYFVANWNLSASEAVSMLNRTNWVGIQFASPTSNPNTRLPGSALTLHQANADLSVKIASWFGSDALQAAGWSE
jgi:hypothetical protein